MLSGWKVGRHSSIVLLRYSESVYFRTFSQGPKKQGCFTCPEEVFLCDSCEKTEFGCCPDLQNAAAGPEFEGCPDEDGEIYEVWIILFNVQLTKIHSIGLYPHRVWMLP